MDYSDYGEYFSAGSAYVYFMAILFGCGFLYAIFGNKEGNAAFDRERQEREEKEERQRRMRGE